MTTKGSSELPLMEHGNLFYSILVGTNKHHHRINPGRLFLNQVHWAGVCNAMAAVFQVHLYRLNKQEQLQFVSTPFLVPTYMCAKLTLFLMYTFVFVYAFVFVFVFECVCVFVEEL